MQKKFAIYKSRLQTLGGNIMKMAMKIVAIAVFATSYTHVILARSECSNFAIDCREDNSTRMKRCLDKCEKEEDTDNFRDCLDECQASADDGVDRCSKEARECRADARREKREKAEAADKVPEVEFSIEPVDCFGGCNNRPQKQQEPLTSGNSVAPKIGGGRKEWLRRGECVAKGGSPESSITSKEAPDPIRPCHF
jgi:hypothetical protein